jgi:hypothetical protein
MIYAAMFAAADQTVPVAQPVAATVTIPQDTPVELMATVEVSTANVTPGTRFKLRVNQPIAIDGRTIVPVGAWAIGEVLTAKGSASLGKSGQMTARLLYLQLGDVQIPLEGDVKEKGRGAGSAGSAFLLAGWVGLFHRGNNAKIKAGEIVMAFVSKDVVLDVSGPTARLMSVSSREPAPAGGETAAPPTVENK